MAIPGNIEMRLGGKTLNASTQCDGYDVYKIIPMLAISFHDDMDYGRIKKWFKDSTEDILRRSSGERISEFSREVVIDLDRRIIMHNGDEEDYNIISIQSGKKFSRELGSALKYLGDKHHFQVFNYHDWKLSMGLIERKYR